MRDLQDIVDDLESEIRRPISVEDRRWRLLAHSAQPDEADAVRRSSILTRETAPPVVAWLEGLGLQRARDLVDIPRNDELGMTRRGCLPIRHGDVLLGFLWVIVGDRPLSGAERAALGRGGEEVAANLWARHRAADERFRRTQTLLAGLLAGDDVATELATTLRWQPTGTFAVAVATGDEDVAERLRRRRAAGDVAWLARDSGIVLLVRDPPTPPAGLATALLEAGAVAGGISAPFPNLARAAAARHEAEVAALCARAQSRPFASWNELGSWALVAGLWTAANRPMPPMTIIELAGHRRGAELVEALEALLDAGGDVAETAKALHLHRATLYRRLERIEEITGLDLARGDDRLLAHLGLRLLRLHTAARS